MLSEILRQNRMPETRCEEAQQRAGKPVPFLQEDFIRRYYPISGLPESKLDDVLETAKRFDASENLRALSWYLYMNFCEVSTTDFKAFPEFIDPLGYDMGMMNILLALSLIPLVEQSHAKANVPLQYAHAAMTRIGTMPELYEKKFGGRFGIRSRSLHFLLNFKDLRGFRIGRFDFFLEPFVERLPHIYESEGKKYLFCGDNWRMRPDGNRVYSGTAEPFPGEFTTHFSDDSKEIHGYCINPATGLAEPKETLLAASECNRILGPGDWTIHFHIPGGGGMKKEYCSESFREAWRFFASYAPEKKAKLIYTVSWIANPAWLDYIPNSNLADLIRSTSIFPVSSPQYTGQYFVFGREDLDFASYPRSTSLERAILDCARERGELRAPGMIVFPDEWF